MMLNYNIILSCIVNSPFIHLSGAHCVPAAVHGQGDPGGEGGLLRGQEGDGARNLLGVAGAAERVGLLAALKELQGRRKERGNFECNSQGKIIFRVLCMTYTKVPKYIFRKKKKSRCKVLQNYMPEKSVTSFHCPTYNVLVTEKRSFLDGSSSSPYRGVLLVVEATTLLKLGDGDAGTARERVQRE